MKRRFPASDTVFELSSLCEELRFNLAWDEVSRDDLFDPDHPSNVYTLEDVRAVLADLRYGFSKTITAMMFGFVADKLSSNYFRAKEEAANLAALDSELSLVRRKLHPQRIADRAPARLWEEQFKSAARELGMVNLNNIINSSVPTERRTLLQVNLPYELVTTMGILSPRAHISSDSEFLSEAMAAYKEFLEDTERFQQGAADGVQLQSRRPDGSIVVVTEESFIGSLPEDSDTWHIVFPDFNAKDERIGGLKLAAKTDDLGELVFRAISFYSFLIDEELAGSSLELLHVSGAIEPVRVIKPKADTRGDPRAAPEVL